MLDWLFDPSGLTPHGFCLIWKPGLIALHAGADAIVGIAYFSIPLAITSFARQRRDLQYNWLAYPFVGFILTCGATHFLSVLTLWVPAYGIEGVVKGITAVLSIATAALLWPLIPRLVALPSPAELARLNRQLSLSIKEQEQISLSLRHSEAKGRAVNVELERRVAERTTDLLEANRKLTEALAERDGVLRSLARSEAEFRASFESAAVGRVLAESSSRRIVRVNQAFAHMLGCDAKDLVGRTSRDLTHPDDIDADAIAYESLLSGTNDTYVHEKRYVRRDGTTFWVRVSATLARVPESEHPLLAIATVEDIDARRRAERDLIEANRRLEEVVQDRTAALEQRDLLLREVYHRVKNNLQMVDSFLAMQARNLESQEGKSALRNLRARINALSLVHHQLMTSKDLNTFDVSPFIKDLSKNIMQGSDIIGVDIVVDACCLNVGLDFAIPLGLVVTELVTNALKHAFPQASGTISVALQPSDANQLMLIVADNGIGMPSLGNTPQVTSGLGGRIVKRLVTQLEGTMTVRTNAGTRVEISLPAPV